MRISAFNTTRISLYIWRRKYHPCLTYCSRVIRGCLHVRTGNNHYWENELRTHCVRVSVLFSGQTSTFQYSERYYQISFVTYSRRIVFIVIFIDPFTDSHYPSTKSTWWLSFDIKRLLLVSSIETENALFLLRLSIFVVKVILSIVIGVENIGNQISRYTVR
jgi:hypothetical protein